MAPQPVTQNSALAGQLLADVATLVRDLDLVNVANPMLSSHEASGDIAAFEGRMNFAEALKAFPLPSVLAQFTSCAETAQVRNDVSRPRNGRISMSPWAVRSTRASGNSWQ
jgi:hypothetical protein